MAMGVGDPRFRQWEKLRRDRFNELLGELAQLLPGYSPCPGITSSSSSEATNTPGALKWSKKEIVERAIHRIQSLEQKQPNQRGFSPRLDEEMPDEDNNEERNALKKKMHALMKQNRKLRELIRIEFQIDLSETEFKKLNVREIKEVIDCVQRDRGKKNASESGNKENIDPTTVLRDEDVFVAPIHTSDHSYALVVRDQPDVVIGDEQIAEEVVETDQPTPVPIQKPIASEPILVEMAPPPALSLPQITILPPAQFLVPSFMSGNVFMRTVNPVEKLPLPRLCRGQAGVQTVNVISSAPKTSVLDLSELRRLRIGRRGQKKRTKKQIAEDLEKEKKAKEAKEAEIEAEAKSRPSKTAVVVEKEVIGIQDVTKVEASLPAAILASEDPNASDHEEDALETIDLTKELQVKETPEPKVVVEKPEKMPQKVVKVTKEKSKLKPDLETSDGKSKSKSSYSIAALCQISVNIGEPSENAMVNSPGMVSLNSVGTGSPAVTPAPTPTPPTQMRSESLPNINEVLNEPKVPTSKLIQELKSKENEKETKEDLPPKDTEKALSSLHEELKRVDESLKEFKDPIPKPERTQSHPQPPPQTIPTSTPLELKKPRKDLSVFDFPERKINSPIPQFPRSPTKNVPKGAQPPPPKTSTSMSKKAAPPKTVSERPRTSAAPFINTTSMSTTFTPTLGSMVPNPQPTNQMGTGQFHHLPTHYPPLPTVPNHPPDFMTSPAYSNPYQSSSTTRYHANSQGYHGHQNMHYTPQDYQRNDYYARNYPSPSPATSSALPSPQYSASANCVTKKLRTRPSNPMPPQLPTEPYGLMAPPDAHSKVFSVNQLVNSKQGQSSSSTNIKKTTKRPASTSSKALKDMKDSRFDERYRAPKQPRQTSSRSSGSSRVRPSYSAESLIGNPNVNPPLDCHINHPGFDPMGLSVVNQGSNHQSQDHARNWAGDQANLGSFQFSSMSPSPAGNIFGADIGSLDFHLSSELGQNIPVSATNSPTKQYLYHKSAVNESNKAKAVNPHQQSDCHHRTSSSHVSSDQQYFSGPLFDNSLLPLQTLTPPTDDSMNSMSYGSFMGPNTFYSNSPASRQSGSVSTSSAGMSFSSQGYTGHNSTASSKQMGHHLPSNQSSSLSNFNLSTIFPEINVNEKLPASLALPPMHKAVISSSSSSASSSALGSSHGQSGSLVPSVPSVVGSVNNPNGTGLSLPSVGGAPPPDFRQLTTPDILPHSIALLGSHSQMGISSVPHPFPGTSFASNMVPGLNFQLSDQPHQ